MITIRMLNSFLLSTLFSVSFMFSSSSDIYGYGQEWRAYFVTPMSAQELQLTANYLYLLCANAIAELKTYQFYTPIADLNQTIRKKINNYQDPKEELNTLKTLLTRLSHVVSTRAIYNKTLDVYMQYYQQHKTANTENSIIDIQLDGQEQLRAFADKQSPATAEQIQKMTAVLNNNGQELQLAAAAYNNLSKGIIPTQLSPEDEQNKSLFILSILAHDNPIVLTVADEITNAVNDLSDNTCHVIFVATGMYKYYYSLLYDALHELPENNIYATTMFSMYGLLPEEQQSPLPHPDHIFKHMLETAKLYSTTEIVS